MIAKQVTVMIPNKPGQLSAVSELLGGAAVNVKALTAATRADGAEIHMVVDDADKAVGALKARGLKTSVYDVLAVVAPDHPGGLNAILRPLKDAGINVEYLYPAIGKHGQNAVIIVGGEPIEAAIKALQADYITILGEELFKL